MALTPELLARLHRRIDEMALDNPDCIEALARLLESYDDDPPGGQEAEPESLTPAA